MSGLGGGGDWEEEGGSWGEGVIGVEGIEGGVDGERGSGR